VSAKPVEVSVEEAAVSPTPHAAAIASAQAPSGLFMTATIRAAAARAYADSAGSRLHDQARASVAIA